ncbi:MAG TPA: N-acyl-D-glucosamine 2-epimerase, partial [Spirochaetia bacterium]|nr:N-acyl-D-glucosamine 2-epimerase [Spirochaetia bacterium]
SYRIMAEHMYRYLRDVFWDTRFGGLYWQVDKNGYPVNDVKFYYVQAFGIYGLAEYGHATGEEEAVRTAGELFGLLEVHGHDEVHGGYREGANRAWKDLGEARYFESFSYQKSMNTTLHVLEALTSLRIVSPDPLVRVRHRELIHVFLERIFDPGSAHFLTFFNAAWDAVSGSVSFGHEIEGSWLLTEAATAADDPLLLRRVETTACALADTVLREGFDEDGALHHERREDGSYDTEKHWWVQAEGIVGFTNAWMLTGNRVYSDAALRLWEYARRHLVDREHGDWFKVVRRDGEPARWPKVGPWECPYHHARLCFQMIERLS